jgi:uncharacterized protein YbjT (DUF2867 family)
LSYVVELLVVGATGGLGRAIVDEALTRGHRVSALVRDASKGRFSESVRMQGGDVLDPQTVAAAARGKDAARFTAT